MTSEYGLVKSLLEQTKEEPVRGLLFTEGLFTYHFAEIAQLVEHNLAKVRVASSSLVFRSFL